MRVRAGQHDRALQVGQRHAVRTEASTSSAIALAETRPRSIGGVLDPGAEDGPVEQHFLAVGIAQAQLLLVAGTGAGLAIEDVAAGHGVGAGGHQRPLDLVLDLLDGGARRLRRAGSERTTHGIGHFVDAPGDLRGDRIGIRHTDLGPERHLDGVGDSPTIERHAPAVALAYRKHMLVIASAGGEFNSAVFNDHVPAPLASR